MRRVILIGIDGLTQSSLKRSNTLNMDRLIKRGVLIKDMINVFIIDVFNYGHKYSWIVFDSRTSKTKPYEKNKNTYREVSNADFLVFFNTNLIPIHNAIVIPNIIKTGKIMPWIRIKWIFCEYTKNTGNKASKIGWIRMNFFEFSCYCIYRYD